MTTAVSVSRPGPTRVPDPTLAALARADARRFARHPLFLFGVAICLAYLVAGVADQSVVDVSVMEATVLPAFFLGVFGFVTAHRLTTSLRRTGDLVLTAPVDAQRRTAALCLSCLVPLAAGLVYFALLLLFGAVWPPEAPAAHGTVAWFTDEPAVDVVAALFANVALAALGGPLLGVAVARWAPFRGSALLGLVVLVFGVIYAMDLNDPWQALAPYINFSDSLVVHGKTQSSWLRDGVDPVWWVGYAASLCGLAAVAALLRDRAHRRRLLGAGTALTASAVACFLMAVA